MPGFLFSALSIICFACLPEAQALEMSAAERTTVDTWYKSSFLGEESSCDNSRFFSGDIPFSFVLGGKHSSKLLPTWKKTVSDAKSDRGDPVRLVTYLDPVSGLEVRCRVTRYADFPALDWTLYFTNRGRNDSPIIERVEAVDSKMMVRPEIAMSFQSLNAATANGVADWQPYEKALPIDGHIDFAPEQGRSSKGATPFFNLQCGDRGVITAIGWTGQWRASIIRNSRQVNITAGMQNLCLSLFKGETIRSPRIIQLYWQGEDQYRGYNLFRRLMFKHIMPRVDGRVVVPPIAKTGMGLHEGDRGTEADQLAHLKSVEGLGFEYFWFDAFYGRDDFPKVGNYVLPVSRGFNTKRFPRGFTNVAKAVNRAGMKYIQWFEPERICPGTLMAQEHPEWVVLPDNGPWGMFNLAIPEAREYITKYLDDMIKQHGIDCLRIDNGVGCGSTPGYDQLWAKLDKADHDRIGINAGITFCDDCRPKNYPKDLLKLAICEGKRIRKYYRGDFYPLTKVTTSHEDWCVTQYHRPSYGDGMILAFRRGKSPLESLVVNPHDIDPKAEYEVTRSKDYNHSKPESIAGKELCKLNIQIDAQPGSMLIEYKIK
ncbi:MAG: alpha-galactosidase [Pirellulales bacterium]|nr:alpha-galactosidase [Pirellulales bacterium]